MESSGRDLFIDIVVDRLIFKSNHYDALPRFTFIPTKDVGLPKTGLNFYGV